VSDVNVETYREVLAILREQVAAIGPDDLVCPTPCSEWDVAGLVSHAIGAITYYERLALGVTDFRPVNPELGPDDDLVASFDGAANAGIAAWSEPGALDREVRMVLGRMRGRDALAVHIGDLGIHAWDLATARGSGLELPDELATSALATWEDVFTRLNRGTAFAAEVPAAPDASPTQRLVSYCGRTP
jgi:uncharacterized protein (TIGR03086 family)